MVLALVMLTAPTMTIWSQEISKKFSMTTRMFIDEMQDMKQQQAAGIHRAAERRLPDGSEMPKPERIIASPDTINGMAYIACFIHLNDPSDLSAVRDLGVKVDETFDGLDFITAKVPVNKLDALAEVDNVTMITVARLMSPATDMARQRTNVDDLLTPSASASALGVSNMYDGTGVVLGIVDTGIDFQHIAFKDKEGNSRIKRAYIYKGSGDGVIYTDMSHPDVTTDDNTGDHGTHTASTAGGSSVIVNKIASDNFEITVTDNHANATYGGMAPGADLYLAGLKKLTDAELMNAIKKIVLYADSVRKPVVVSNSWGSIAGPHDGQGEFASFVSTYFGDGHPNHIILFASSNYCGNGTVAGGGFFIKSTASQASPLGTIMGRTNHLDGDYYQSQLSVAYADQPINCELYVLDQNTGAVLMSRLLTGTTTINDISVTVDETTTTYYTGKLRVEIVSKDGYHYVYLNSSGGLTSTNTGAYMLALRLYPTEAETTAHINMWAGQNDYFTNRLSTEGITWTNGTDDMCVSDETTIADAISVGAYVTKDKWSDYNQDVHLYTRRNPVGEIAVFSSYATADMSPTRLAYPWITAPGTAVVAGVNHHHTTDVDTYSYFGESKKALLVVNNADNPYGVMQGTSMATPVAAGIVAQWLQAAKEEDKSLTVNDVKEIMQLSAINDDYTTNGPNASHFGKGKIDALAGINVIKGGLPLADNNYNHEAINTAYANRKTYNVTLSGRTLTKNNEWNTLCLPFDVTLDGSPLAGAEARTLSTASLTDGTLTLNFSEPVSSLTAGTPYIIKWPKAEGYDEADPATRDIENPTFSGVTITSTAPTPVNFTGGKFVGQYSPFIIDSSNKNEIILLSTGNKLGYSKNARTLRSFRCHFEVPAPANAPAMNKYVINFGEETGIKTVHDKGFTINDSDWYTLDGRKLSRKPSVKGIYIHNGVKVVVK